MTSPADTRAAEIRATQTEALLNAAPEDAGQGALAPLRAAATDRFRALGAPLPRDEYWRFTSPARFVAPAAPAARAAAAPSLAPSLFAAAEPLRLVFANGRFAAAASDPLDALEGVEIHVLSAGAPGWVAEALGALEAEGQRPVPRPLAALNGALATDGLAIRATGAAPRPIEIVHLGEGPGAVYLRHLVLADPGADLTVLETGGAARFSAVIEAEIAQGARLRHLRLQTDETLEEGAAALFAALGREASLKSFTLSSATGERALRNESVVWMRGDDGSAHLAGAVVAGDKAQADNTVFLTHDALRCESRQVFKNVLDQAARAIFQGKILVKDSAQQTDGYQLSQSVLLSDAAAFLAKPELEIYADDVKCSHGSTTGALDETALFYLRARGVDDRAARALLIEAFLEEAIAEIGDDALEAAIRREGRRLIGVDREDLGDL